MTPVGTRTRSPACATGLPYRRETRTAIIGLQNEPVELIDRVVVVLRIEQIRDQTSLREQLEFEALAPRRHPNRLMAQDVATRRHDGGERLLHGRVAPS